MQKTLSLVDILMLESALKLEFLEAEHLGYHRVDVEYVDHYQDDEHNGENNIECLPENWDDVSLTHHLRKCCFSIIYDLQEIVAKRCGNSGTIAV